ncbi:MAG: flagellar export chaperone FlgN [Planctomycetota bacterium]|jgi:hypothetical protein
MTRCEETAGHLAECLEALNQSLMELTAVFRVKRQVLARADMEALSELLEREEKVTEALFEAESRREVLVEEIAAATGCRGRRLIDIAEALPTEAAELLFDCGSRLRVTVEVLVREARIVAMICRAAVEHYEKLIRIITGADLESPVYTAAGAKSAPGGRNIIDQAL